MQPVETSRPASDAKPHGPIAISTIDVWKLLAVVLMTVDHYGHFLADDETVWRAIGRASVPILFFLIGFARTRTIPLLWLVVGAVLTVLDVLYNRELSASLLNIFFSFALIRLALPWVERHIAPSAVATAGFAGALGLLEVPVGAVLEYGALGWLFALVGLLHRRWIDGVSPDGLPMRVAVAVAAAAGYVYVEHRIHDFPGWELTLCVALMAFVTFALMRFRPGVALPLRPGWLPRTIQWAGRSTLWLYAVPLAALYIYGIFDPDDDEDDD